MGRLKKDAPTIAQRYPELLDEFSMLENHEVDLHSSFGVHHKTFIWRCRDYGHYRRTTIPIKLKYPACPICTKRLVLAGFSDAGTTHPTVWDHWDFDLSDFEPTSVMAGSDKIAWWKCKNEDHSYPLRVSAFVRGARCSYCSNYLLLVGFNDLASKAPHLLAQWDSEANGSLLPSQINWMTVKQKVAWICHLGHTWEAAPYYRTVVGQGCPVCSGNKILRGFNDFGSLCPELLQEWDWEKNEKSPYEVGRMSKYKAWWRCKNGHKSWPAAVSNRVAVGSGCPRCRSNVSKAETQVFFALKESFSNLTQTQELEIEAERDGRCIVDMLLISDSHRIVIEYDGEYFHRSKRARDLAKTSRLLQEGYTVIRMRETPLPSLSIEHPFFFETTFKERQDLNITVAPVEAILTSLL